MANGNVTIDLSNYKDKFGSRVAPGRYRVVVDDVEMDKAKSGNDMVMVWFRILDGEFAEMTVMDRLVLTEKSLFRMVNFMQAIGIPTPRKRLALNVGQFKGKQLEIDVEDGEPYLGRVKSEVRGYLKIEGLAKQADLPADTSDSVEDLPEVTGSDEPVDLDDIKL